MVVVAGVYTSTMVVVAGMYTAATAAAASASDNIRHPSRRLAEQSPSCTAEERRDEATVPFHSFAVLV